MDAGDVLLPEGFEELAPLVDQWALPTEQQRYARRMAASLPELRTFYEAMFPHMDAVMQHLAAYPADDLDSLPAQTRTLYRLALSCFEASHPIELKWKSTDLVDAFPASRIIYQAPSNTEC